MKAYIHTLQSGNSNDFTEMYEIFNPEIPGLEPPNPGISGLRKMPGIPVFGIPGLESLDTMLGSQICLFQKRGVGKVHR